MINVKQGLTTYLEEEAEQFNVYVQLCGLIKRVFIKNAFKRYFIVSIIFTILGVSVLAIFSDWLGFKAWIVILCYIPIRFILRYVIEHKYVFGYK